MALYRPVSHYEGALAVKTLSCEGERLQAYQLRHRVFAQQLKWVPISPNGLEIDHYDLWATSVGLFSESGELLGMFRMLPTEGPFMLEREFRPLLGPSCRLTKQPDASEITRLAIDPNIKDKGLSTRLMLVLFKGVYQWSLTNHVRYLYMVVEKRFLRVLRTIGFPCEPLSTGAPLPPADAISMPAMLDWDKFRAESAAKRPQLLEWISALRLKPVISERTGESSPGAVTPVEPWTTSALALSFPAQVRARSALIDP